MELVEGRSLKAAPLLLLAGLAAGCSEPQSDVSVVQTFWDAVAAKDLQTVESLVSEPSQVEFLRGAKIDLSDDDYAVLEATTDGVNVRHSVHCRSDVVAPTIVVEANGKPSIDLMGTLSVLMKAQSQAQPTKQYCYAFEDQPMQGKLNGESWQARHVNRAVYDFGTKKSEEIKLVSEPCEDPWCNGLTSPSLLISNLDYSGSGGNFDTRTSITIFTPPGTNQVISDGSYRLTTTDDGETKLEISFHRDEGNFVNGFISLPASEAD